MRIERVEEICLEFLRHTQNPLTPVSHLYQKCIEEEGAGAALTEEALLEFLRGHADIFVAEGVADDELVSPDAFSDAGIAMGPRAILKSRMPTPGEIKDMFQEQVAQMRENLLYALKQAKADNDAKAIRKIETALDNAESIEERLKEL